MNEEVFLRALRDDPADEVAAMALADWLDEDGQADRAELARLALRLRDPLAPGRASLEARAVALLRGGTRPVVAEAADGVGMRLALVRPGRFRMGATILGREREELSHPVEIAKAYYLGVFPVTQGQYEAVMGENVASFRRGERNQGAVAGLDTDELPIDQVTWDQANEFCRRLSLREGRAYRLPTEAEWEYACRAGTTTAFNLGDAIDSGLANFDGRKAEGGNAREGVRLSRPTAVGSYLPNAFGLYDTHGNLMEWCADWYGRDYYQDSPSRDPSGPASGQYRVARGGCWYFPASAIRSASRNFFPPSSRDSCVGFRVAVGVS